MRLIDAEVLAKFIDFGHLRKPNEKAYSENDIREMIDMCVTINAPVRHGRWEPYSIEPEAYDIAGVKSWAKKYRCSECRFLHTVIEDFGIYTFCPNCGARMDGEKNE